MQKLNDLKQKLLNKVNLKTDDLEKLYLKLDEIELIQNLNMKVVGDDSVKTDEKKTCTRINGKCFSVNC